MWLLPLYVLSVHQPLAVALPSPNDAALVTIGAGPRYIGWPLAPLM